MAAHFGREGDLALLQTRPPGKDELWRPRHTINITGHPNVPASTYAKVIVDTAVSLTGGRGQNPFFPTKAQLAIQTGFEVLRQMGAYVTIPNIHRLLLNEEDASAAIEALINKGDQRSLELVVALRDGFLANRPSSLAVCRELSARILSSSSIRKSPKCSARMSPPFNGSNRRRQDRLYRHAAKVPERAALHQQHPEALLLLSRLEPVRQTISPLYSRGSADAACTLHALFLCCLVQLHATSCEDN